jgi:hypothetical protein
MTSSKIFNNVTKNIQKMGDKITEKDGLLHNRILLYSTFVLSLLNLVFFMVDKDFNSITFFILIGFLTSFFSKNMMVVLLLSLILTNILKYGSTLNKEGIDEDAKMDGMEDELEGMSYKILEGMSDEVFEGMDDDVLDGIEKKLSEGMEEDELLEGMEEDEILEGMEEDEILEGMEDDELLEGMGDKLLEGMEDELLEGMEHDELLEGMDEDERLEGMKEDKLLEGMDDDELLEGMDDDELLEGMFEGARSRRTSPLAKAAIRIVSKKTAGSTRNVSKKTAGSTRNVSKKTMAIAKQAANKIAESRRAAAKRSAQRKAAEKIALQGAALAGAAAGADSARKAESSLNRRVTYLEKEYRKRQRLNAARRKMLIEKIRRAKNTKSSLSRLSQNTRTLIRGENDLLMSIDKMQDKLNRLTDRNKKQISSAPNYL